MSFQQLQNKPNMVDIGKFIYGFLDPDEQRPKTKYIVIISKDSNYRLGHISYHGQWNQYCYFTEKEHESVFEHTCLIDIVKFLERLNLEHRQEVKSRKTSTQSSLLPARECPECGNSDYDDDFVIMNCSKCGTMYIAKDAGQVWMQ